MNAALAPVFAVMAGLLAFAGMAHSAVPAQQQIGGMQITDDTALYQNISEINSPKLGHVDFDGDLERLSQLERRYVDRKRVTMPQPRAKAGTVVRGKSSSSSSRAASRPMPQVRRVYRER